MWSIDKGEKRRREKAKKREEKGQGDWNYKTEAMDKRGCKKRWPEDTGLEGRGQKQAISSPKQSQTRQAGAGSQSRNEEEFMNNAKGSKEGLGVGGTVGMGGVGRQCLERKDRGAGGELTPSCCEGADTPFLCGGQLLPVSNSVGYKVVRTSSYTNKIGPRNGPKEFYA